MRMIPYLLILLVTQCSELCVAIKVPLVWEEPLSDVTQNEEQKFSVETFKPQIHSPKQKPIPVEYFEYPAKKPQFAVDIATYHGVKSPENHYKAYPIKPYTGVERPDLGKYLMLEKEKVAYKPFQVYAPKNEGLKHHISPTSSEYEVFHPYKAEEPALKEIYKDPVLNKIRGDLLNSKNRHQKYENDAGNVDISSDEYLESQEETDRKKVPHPNIPAQYEIHRPQRRPVYYKVPVRSNYREQVLNHKFRHPWNQNFVKVRPVHYYPLKHHLQKLRQHHSLKYDDENNEYPQLPQSQNYVDPSNGYDIYEKGKENYVKLRNNLDEKINNLVKENNPSTFEKLELQKHDNIDETDEEEFVPIKSYAQVRKTENTKHLPREAAFEDAASYDEIKNAPRLREAIKSTKAQTVYTEEGYEDAAYDHAGEQKHASDHEGHGGYLKEKEISGGKYKAPSVSGNYADAKGSTYRDQSLHGKKWKEDDKGNSKNTETEDFSDEEEELVREIEAEVREDIPDDTEIENLHRDKREGEFITNTTVADKNGNNSSKNIIETKSNFKVPEINLDSTFLKENDILKIAKLKNFPKQENLNYKYPYYFQNIKDVQRDSPLKYAENLKFIPLKSKGGTEFYDSKSKFECPEVEDDVDPLPEKLKSGKNPNEDSDDDNDEIHEKKDKAQENYQKTKGKPRLKGLGDKIDCFKTKYFGENPLDSPFFKEDIIIGAEPITIPKLSTFKLKDNQNLKLQNFGPIDHEINIETKPLNLSSDQLVLNKIFNSSTKLEPLINRTINFPDKTISFTQKNQSVYDDIIKNIKSETINFPENIKKISTLIPTYTAFSNIEDVTKLPSIVRKKRAAPFVYEPYKIIRDVQVPDLKKTTTTSNVSPLIKQLQSSKIVDTVIKTNQDKEQSQLHRSYKNIDLNDRDKIHDKLSPESQDSIFIDISSDKRRGEPRYEIKHFNHKSKYTPVNNKKNMSLEDYQSLTTRNNNHKSVDDRENIKQIESKTEPFYDISKFLPKQDKSASTTVTKVLKTTTLNPKSTDTSISHVREIETDDEYEDDYTDEEEENKEIVSTTTTTTTTIKPSFRRRVRTTSTTTQKPDNQEEQLPKLRLVTRFRSTPAPVTEKTTETVTKQTAATEEPNHRNTHIPKYREQKRKSSKSTLVTDTKRYGDEADKDDDMKKDEVDAMIGVKQDMDEYTPEYEKRNNKKSSKEEKIQELSEEDYEGNEDDEEESDEDEDEDSENSQEEEDEDESDSSEEDTDEEDSMIITTTEHPKRTIPRTTIAPLTTTESQNTKFESRPIIRRKKIEIHKEIPADTQLPHVTQFKQDIKEVEIIKEMPPKETKKPPPKNIEALELYKDENLAKEVNKLTDVEVFKENLDLQNGPRHGGNYRSAKLLELQDVTTTKPLQMHGGHLKLNKEDTEASSSKKLKLVELSDTLSSKRMHGGNLKYLANSENEKNDYESKSRQTNKKSEKLIDFDDYQEDDTPNMHGGNFKSYKNDKESPLHGGNYKRAKLVHPDVKVEESENVQSKSKPISTRHNAAMLLDSFARAVPILTTTPAYILDPSKRMYYYVD